MLAQWTNIRVEESPAHDGTTVHEGQDLKISRSICIVDEPASIYLLILRFNTQMKRKGM